MKLLVLSDLHVEFAPYVPEPAVLAAVDAVLLAGDIHVGAQAPAWSRQTFGDKPIVQIAGNHELYHGDWQRTLDEIREAARWHEVHFLENDELLLNGVQFLGSTLWTDFLYFGPEQIRQAMNEARRYMADYRLIAGCSPEATIERHQASLAWLQAKLNGPGAASQRVVITHHYPHAQSTAREYKSDLCTAAFGSQLPNTLFTQAGLWIHGHTHSSCAYEVMGCQVRCNPRGYPLRQPAGAFENNRFQPGLVLTQDDEGRWVEWQAS